MSKKYDSFIAATAKPTGAKKADAVTAAAVVEPTVVEPTVVEPAVEAVVVREASSNVIILDPIRTREVKLESPRQAEKTFRAVARRLGRTRRALVELEVGGEYITNATHVHWPHSSVTKPAAFVVFVTTSGEVRIPFESMARAARVARDSSIKLLSGREATIENAVDGMHSVFEAFGIRAEEVT